MKKLGKILIFIAIVLVILAGVIYIDYFIVKKKSTLPKIAIKVAEPEKEMIIYKAVFYKVLYCTSDKSITIGTYKDSDSVCPLSFEYKDGYYTNSSGFKISERNLKVMTYQNIYTREMIDIMNSESEVNNAVYIAYNYIKNTPKEVENNSNYVVFPTFNEKTYRWSYEETEDNYYCFKNNEDESNILYSKYVDGKCDINYKPIKMEQKWCSLYETSTLQFIDDIKNKYCE